MAPRMIALCVEESFAFIDDDGTERTFWAHRTLTIDDDAIRDETSRTAAGLLPYPPPPPSTPALSFRQRLRAWWQGKRERLGEWIAGRRFDDEMGW